jgi:sugar lactone lactonase YvrE
VAAGTAQIVLRSPWARQAMAMPRYSRSHIHHLTLELFARGPAGETFVQRQTVEADRLDADFVFSGLARQATYVVKAAAYKAPGEAPADRISTEDIGSMTEIAVGEAADVAVAPLRVQLIDVPVTWGHVATLPLQSGGLNVAEGALAGAAIDPAGNLYVADAGQGRIAMVTPYGQVSTFASDVLDATDVAFRPDGGMYAVSGLGEYLMAIPPGGGQAVRLNVPLPDVGPTSGLAVGPDGTVYMSLGPQIVRWRPGEPAMTAWVGESAGLEEPQGLDVDAAGNLYVVDRGAGTLHRVSPEGRVSTVASGLGLPVDVVVSPDGDLYVTTQSCRVHAVTPDGQVRLVAGSGLPAKVDGHGASASFGSPSGIACDSRGTLYVVDAAYQAIRRIF